MNEKESLARSCLPPRTGSERAWAAQGFPPASPPPWREGDLCGLDRTHRSSGKDLSETSLLALASCQLTCCCLD